MEPRPAHSGGSVSAKAGAELAALISTRGTSVFARRSIMFGKPVAAGVWQTGKSGPTNGGDMSTAVAPARVTMFPASSVTSAAPPSAAAPAETSSFCDRVNVAMSYSKIGRRKKSAEFGIQRVALSRDPKETTEREFWDFSCLSARQLQRLYAATFKRRRKAPLSHVGSAALFMSASPWQRGSNENTMIDPALPRWSPVARQSANESFDCLEHWLLSTRKEPMIIAVELNELSAGDLAGHIAACRNTYCPVVPAVQHQRGHRDPWQEVSHIGVAQRLEHGPNAAGTGGRAQQPGPPGPRLEITRKARREGVDPGRATPFADELLAPGVILACLQRVRIVRRPTALGQ